MNFIPEKLRSESILDFLKNETVIAMKETQFKSVVRSKLNLDEKNTKESLETMFHRGIRTISESLFDMVIVERFNFAHRKFKTMKDLMENTKENIKTEALILYSPRLRV